LRGACQDYSTAIKHYTEALEDDEEDVVALLNRSAAYYCMDLFKTSLKDADAALALDNTNAKAWERRGLALQGMGRKNEGQKAFTDGLMIGGDIDGYLHILRQLGLNPPSKHMVSSIASTSAGFRIVAGARQDSPCASKKRHLVASASEDPPCACTGYRSKISHSRPIVARVRLPCCASAA